MYHFVFTSEINSVPPHQSPQKYPCFLCQVERFELFEHLEKYPEHAKGLSPEISQLYLNLMLIHDQEHQSNINSARYTCNQIFSNRRRVYHDTVDFLKEKTVEVKSYI